MKHTVPIRRLVESCVEVNAQNIEEAKIKVQKMLDDGLDVDDDNQYWNDWEVADDE